MKVLVVENEKPIIDAIMLSFLVEWPGIDIVPVESGRAGIDTVKNESPDIIIQDISLADVNGFDVLRDIRSFTDTPIIILTEMMEENEVMRFLDLGADDFIIKPFSKMELIARVKTLIKKHPTKTGRFSLTCGHLTFDPEEARFTIDGNDLNLTQTEAEILLRLMEDTGKVVRYATLAESVWNNGDRSAINSLKVHIHNLREKLRNTNCNTDGHPNIHTWSGLGYSLDTEEDLDNNQ